MVISHDRFVPFTVPRAPRVDAGGTDAGGTDTFTPRRVSAAPSSSQAVVVSGGGRSCRSDNNPPIAMS